MDNPEVRAEIRRVMGYWLELGLSGFRVDAVPFILESKAPGGKNASLRFEYLYEMRRFLQWRQGNDVLLGEANVLPQETRDYFGSKGDGIHMMFNFHVNQRLFYALATGDTAPLVDALRDTRKIPPGAQWANFLRNHDELDLGRLTGPQRAKVFARFGPEERMQLYHRGIRRRLAPMIGDRRQIELANSLMFSLPGTPVIRYGDEIGMGDDLSLRERDAVRTPMQWSPGPQAGFSRARKTVHPVISGGAYGFERVNVESQRSDRDSLLSWTARMIRLRKEAPEIGWGSWKILATGTSSVLALRYNWEGRSVVVLHNFDQKPHEVRIRLGVEGGETLVNLLFEERSRAGPGGTHRIALPAFGYRWYRVGSLHPQPVRKEGEGL